MVNYRKSQDQVRLICQKWQKLRSEHFCAPPRTRSKRPLPHFLEWYDTPRHLATHWKDQITFYSLFDRNNYHCIVVRSFLFNLSIIKNLFHEICGRHLPISHCEFIIIWDQAMEYNTLSDCYMHEVVSSSSALPMVAKTKRNVTFNPTCTVRTPTCRSITDEEKLASYYNKNELRSMKREAVNGLLQLHATVSEQRPDSIDSAITTDTLRGMELVLQPQRRKNRELVRQSVLKYQMLLDSKSNLTDEQRHLRLAHITAKLNRWSSHVAFQTAWRDACEAVDFSPETMMDYHCSPFTTDVPMMSTAVGSLSSTTSQCEMQFAWTNVESFPIYCMEH